MAGKRNIFKMSICVTVFWEVDILVSTTDQSIKSNPQCKMRHLTLLYEGINADKLNVNCTGQEHNGGSNNPSATKVKKLIKDSLVLLISYPSQILSSTVQITVFDRQ